MRDGCQGQGVSRVAKGLVERYLTQVADGKPIGLKAWCVVESLQALTKFCANAERYRRLYTC